MNPTFHPRPWATADSTMCNLRMLITAATALGCLVMATAANAADVTRKVDSTRNWLGYVSVFDQSGTWLDGPSGVVGDPGDLEIQPDMTLEDLRAEFIPSGASFPLNTALVLAVNTSTHGDVNADDKILQCNFYVDVGTNLSGDTLTFEGTVISNNVPQGWVFPSTGFGTAWRTIAFIKTFAFPGAAPDTTAVDLNPGAFTVTKAIPTGYTAQYGFFIEGSNTDPDGSFAPTGIGIVVEDSDPGITLQPVGGTFLIGTNLSLTAGAIGATPLTYQWQRDGVTVTDGGTVSGATTTNLTISSVTTGDSGDYTFIATDTAGSATSEVAVVTVPSVLITDQPDNVRTVAGTTVQFVVEATSPDPISYKWQFVEFDGTTNTFVPPNLPAFYNPPSYSSGGSSNILTLTNLQPSDAGYYQCRLVVGGDTIYSARGELRVLTPAQLANVLDNPGFEDAAVIGNKTNAAPWVRFYDTDLPVNPDDFGRVVDATDEYFLGGNVSIQDGTYSSFTGFATFGYQGIYQDADARPGDVFRADMWFYNPSGDPLPGPAEFATNISYVEVQFRSGTTSLQQYTTDLGALASTNLPTQDTWFQLEVDRPGDFGTLPPGPDGPYLVAPPGTEYVRFQITMLDQGGSADYGGSLYYDSARLMLKIPVAINVVDNGSTVDISWESQGATTYQVQSAETVDGPWTNVETADGDGSLITKTYAIGPGAKYYRVLTL